MSMLLLAAVAISANVLSITNAPNMAELSHSSHVANFSSILARVGAEHWRKLHSKSSLGSYLGECDAQVKLEHSTAVIFIHLCTSLPS